MGFRRWLIKALGGQDGTTTTELAVDAADEVLDDAIPEPEDPLEAEAAGLDFKSAIEAHQRWKIRLNDVIAGRSQEDLDPAVVARDDCCALGKWIHGVGGDQFATQPEFAELKRRHAHFHVCAGHVLILAQSERKQEALEEINQGNFATISREVVMHLAHMYTRLKQ
ncbi:CZB domain-containing protein [Marinobacterium marinum]|uniref:CZB domain-containing protein n=1 Tax=Marinobacterium marinum TaxID=2756129 RepID=A0A7W1WZW2_9GAMM|nr:CZB domain-containing protein [Marinobacterium marinum]MBA4503300.1 CZB domain-containing protein [Marinobacterium marinum]